MSKAQKGNKEKKKPKADKNRPKTHVSAYKAAQEQGKPSFNPFAKKTWGYARSSKNPKVWARRYPRRNARKRVPSPNRRRALELLAASPNGATEALLVAQGFTIDLLVELIRAGVATAKASA
jgi:hypothetical protein